MARWRRYSRITGSPAENPESPLTPGDKPCCTESPVRPPSRRWCCAARRTGGTVRLCTNEKSGFSQRHRHCAGCRAQTLEVSERTRGIAVAPDGSRLFLTDSPTRSLVVVDLDSGKPVASWPLGESPEGVYISTDGKLLAAAVEEDNSVALLQAGDGKTLAQSRSKARIRNMRSSAPTANGSMSAPKMPNRST